MSETNQESLGKFLKTEREKRSISIEQLAYATRIGIKMLRALEEDLHEELPAQPFVRGYLQAYAKYVGLDVQDLLLRYQHHLATHPETTVKTLSSHYVYVRERYQEQKQLLLIISLVIVLIACAGTYFSLKAKRERGKQENKATAMQQILQATNTSVATSPQTTPTTATSVNTKAASPALSTSGTKTATQTATATTLEAPKKHSLVLQTTEDAWIRFQTDDDPVRELILRAEKTVTLRANKVFKLFSGNLGAITGSLDNKEFQSLAQTGRTMSAVLPESEIPNYPLPLFPTAASAVRTSTSTSTTQSTTSQP